MLAHNFDQAANAEHPQPQQLHLRGSDISQSCVRMAALYRPAHLVYPCYRPWDTGTLPEWFTNLKQLTRLELPIAADLAF